MKVEPFLKWAGGKRWLTRRALPSPTQYERYVEPFLGSGAVFFAFGPPKALLSDLNAELIDLYQVMRDQPEQLLRALKAHHTSHSNSYYYKIRSWQPEDLFERAARMLYLNRTCWNGLYRVNRKGEFNVPIGTKSSVVFPDEDFRIFSERLRAADIICSDFEEVINECKKGDFLFVDPPYTVNHNLNGFLKYNEKIFRWEDQIRLKEALQRAIIRGVSVLMTNADHPSIRDLFENIGSLRTVSRASVLAGNPSRRGMTSEALFTANL
jgi:DNA adenine methylase